MRIYKNTNLGLILKDMRLKNELSQESMAEKIGCTRQSIIAIEKGESEPQYKTFCSWLNACGMQLIIRSIKKTTRQIDITR